MAYIYSNWNRNRNLSLQHILGLPRRFWQKLKTEKAFRQKFLMRIIYSFGTVLIASSIMFAMIAVTLPDPAKLDSRIVAQSTKIYARDGTTLLYEIHGEAKRTVLPYSDLPENIKEATIAIEDKNFYNNPGISISGILRSIWVDVTSGSKSQGGSTITQQFARNSILTREKSFIRKIKEIVLAIEINERYTKDQILALYLNEIPYGQNAYGIEAASQSYFGKHAKDLTLPEAAYLAALPQAPSFYNPNGANRSRLDNRKDVVLDQMFQQGYITEQERDEAQATKVSFSKIKDAILAPHFVFYVESLLAEKYGEKTLEEGGLKVITTLDWKMQEIAEKAVADGVARNEKSNRAENAGLVAIDPKTGQILAMVGSRNYFDEEHDGQVNVTIQELQPGSSFKPYVYATAFKQGMSPATMLVDVKTNFGSFGNRDYVPSNYNGQDYGLINMRKALAGSLNISAVKTLALVGVGRAVDTAKEMGITSDINADRCGLSLVLGGCEIKLVDHVAAMGVFATEGVKHEKTPILKITDSRGQTLEEYTTTEGQQVLDPQVAYQVISVMTDNDARSYVFGSRSPLVLPGRVVAAKTGTTQEWRDGWTLGYTPSLAAGVWVGNNDHSKMRAGADGVVVAAPIWNQFMREALKDTPAEIFPEPAGIQRILVDSISGKLPTEFTPSTKYEVFAQSNLPTSYDDVHVMVKINKYNGKLANELTPPEAVEERLYTVIRSERPDNANWEAPVAAWAATHGYSRPPREQDDGIMPEVLPEDMETTVNFLTPTYGQTISSLPMNVQVGISGTRQPNSVELLLNGKSVGSLTQAPYSFSINSASNGWQTLIAIATMADGSTIQNSTRVNVDKDSPKP